MLLAVTKSKSAGVLYIKLLMSGRVVDNNVNVTLPLEYTTGLLK